MDLTVPLDHQIEGLKLKLFTNAEVSTISLDDPRFSWLGMSAPDWIDAATIGDMVEQLPVHETTVRLLDHLVAYTQEALTAKLEDELQDIVSPLVAPAHAAAIIARLGWTGREPVTLASAASLSGVSRERIRQLEERLLDDLEEIQVWTPVLDRVLAIAARSAPVNEKSLASHLHAAGLSAKPDYSAASLINAQHALRRSDALALFTRNGHRVVARKDDPQANTQFEQTDTIRLTASKLVGNQGMTSIVEVARVAGKVESLPAVSEALASDKSFEITTDGWVFRSDHVLRNPLVNRVDKLLAIAPTVPVEEAITQLRRESREPRALWITPEAIRAFILWHPLYELVDDYIRRTRPVSEEEALSPAERVIVDHLRQKGGTDFFPSLRIAAASQDVTQVNLTSILRNSPIIRREGDRGTYIYHLVGQKDTASGDRVGPVAEQLDPREVSDGGGQPPNTRAVELPPSHTADVEVVESQGVRQRISEILETYAGSVGLCALDELTAEVRRSDVLVDTNQLRSAITLRIEALAVLPGDWVISIGPPESSPPTRYLRRMLAVYQGSPLPEEVAYAQFQRQKEAYASLTREAFLSFVDRHPDADLDGGRIRARQGLVLREDQELSHLELPIVRALRRHGALTPEQLWARMGRQWTAGKTRFRQQLLFCAVVVDTGMGTYEALQPSTRQRRLIAGRTEHDSSTIHVAPVPEHPDSISLDIPDASIIGNIHLALIACNARNELVDLQSLRDSLEVAGAPAESAAILHALAIMPEVAVLPGGKVAFIGDRAESVITRGIRKILAVAAPISIDKLKVQLGRAVPSIAHLGPDAFDVLINQHPDIAIEDGTFVVPRDDLSLVTRNELNKAERKVHDALSAIGPIRSAGTIGLTGISTQDMQRILELSVVIAETSDGYSALAAIDDPARRMPAPLYDDPDLPPISTPHEGVGAHGFTKTEVWPLGQVLDMVNGNVLVLPEIQRGYVWKPPQVRDLVDSLYRGFPIGTLLIWQTEESLRARAIGQTSRSPGVPTSSGTMYLLDGQQRITSLLRALGDQNPLLFDTVTEEFSTDTIVSRRNRRNLSVSGILHDPARALLDLPSDLAPEEAELAKQHVLHLATILERKVAVDILHNFSYEEVTNIFVRVNQKGTRLKAAELALAQIAQRLPNMISDDVSAYAASLHARGWNFDDQFLLRCLTAVARDRSSYKHLVSMHRDDVQEAWARTMPAMEEWLSLLESRLGITSMEFLTSINGHVVPIAWLASAPANPHLDRLLEWFVHAQVWSRYTGASETNMDFDLQRLRLGKSGNPFPTLQQSLRATGQSARIAQADLVGSRRQSSLRLLMYLNARRLNSPDIATGIPITSTGTPVTPLEMVQVFPTTLTRKHGTASELSELTNYVLGWRGSVTTDPVLTLVAESPEVVKAAHSLPGEGFDFEPRHFREFLRQRRRLLVASFNETLRWLAGPLDTEILSVTGNGEVELDHEDGSRMREESGTYSRDLPVHQHGALGAIQERIHERILGLGRGVVQRAGVAYFSYLTLKRSTTRPFATLAKDPAVLEWTIDIPASEIHDPRGFTDRVPLHGKRGIGDTQFRISSEADVNYAMFLIEQAYERAIRS
jgi:predicted transport protein